MESQRKRQRLAPLQDWEREFVSSSSHTSDATAILNFGQASTMLQAGPVQRRNGKKRFTKRPKQSVSAKADLALKLVRQIKYKFDGDIKKTDSTLNTTVDSSGRVDQVAAITHGASEVTRVGDQIKILRVKGTIVVRNDATATNDTLVRVVLIKGNNERATAPTWASTFEATGSIGLTHVPKLYDSRFSTRVLYDKILTITPNNDSNVSERIFDIDVPCNFRMRFNGAATTCEDGGLYLFAVSNQATLVPNYVVFLRTTFTDN